MTPDRFSHTLVNLEHGQRTPEQLAVMTQIIADKVCPFCRDFCQGDTPTYHKKPILRRGTSWILTPSQYPYSGTRTHLLLILTTHKEHVSRLTPDEWTEFGDFVSTATREFSADGGTLLVRFGNTHITGGSVSHLHAQLVVGGTQQEGGEKILTQIGYQLV